MTNEYQTNSSPRHSHINDACGLDVDRHLRMTPAQQAKAAGLKNLSQVSHITGVSLNTLTNWHRDKPELFRIVLLGCVAELGA
tara:strand:- start:461 stop:709 length:249 start_codon:yes stop_codon:yes gene_type:complete